MKISAVITSNKKFPENMDTDLFRIRLHKDIEKLLGNTGKPSPIDALNVVLHDGVASDDRSVDAGRNGEKDSGEDSLEKKSRQYVSRDPLYSFNRLVLPEEVMDEIVQSIDAITFEKQLFEEWNLRDIEPFPRSALNFHGGPGTGKTLAAHAIANRMQRKILVASYAQIESKYHGDGPKNVEALFYAAEKAGAVLFIDEADSLLSRRLTHVTQGSEQAINSMRSQLLICLEKFSGVVVFATNLVRNYDPAFETRVRSIHFPSPDEACRTKIWKSHFVAGIPLGDDINAEELAASYTDLCGREIKNIVLDACVSARRSGEDRVYLRHFHESAKRLISQKDKLHNNGNSGKLSASELKKIEDRLKKQKGCRGRLR